jgi:hypothetical protein
VGSNPTLSAIQYRFSTVSTTYKAIFRPIAHRLGLNRTLEKGFLLSSVPMWVVFSLLWHRGPASNLINSRKEVIFVLEGVAALRATGPARLRFRQPALTTALG